MIADYTAIIITKSSRNRHENTVNAVNHGKRLLVCRVSPICLLCLSSGWTCVISGWGEHRFLNFRELFQESHINSLKYMHKQQQSAHSCFKGKY